MASGRRIPLKKGPVITQDGEVDLIDRLTVTMAQAGVRVDRINVANVYVALKHKPMVILTSRAGNGKCAFIKCLSSILTGSNDLQRQILPGHAWYLGGSPVNTVLIGMHSRLITEKLLFIIEEALQPENAQRIFMVGLTHISPAELLSFFTAIASQRQHNQIMRVGDAHLSVPIPFPSNLLLIGTMDTECFDFWDEDLLCGTTVIEWRTDIVGIQSESARESKNLGRAFLHSKLRNSRKAYEKLLTVTAATKQPLQAVMLVRSILQGHGLEFSSILFDEVILYIANAWSAEGHGLFNPFTSYNLAIAADLALAQLVLPRYLETIRSSETLQAGLFTVLDAHLPRCNAFLKRHNRRHPYLISSKGI